MKLIFTRLLQFVFVASAIQLHAQTLLNENFNYKSGALTTLNSGANVSGGNWISFSGSGNNLTVGSNSLSYTGYGSSGQGGSLGMIGTTASAEDVYRSFSKASTGTVYCAMLINVNDTVGLSANTSTTGDYFAGTFTSTSTATYYTRLTIRKGSTGNTFQLGMKGNTNAILSFSSTNLDVATTHLIVFAYNFVTGTNNDTAFLWINPSTTTASTADIKSTLVLGDATDIGRIALRQGNLGTPNCTVDGIHLGMSWNDVMSNASTAPAPVNTVTYTATPLTTASFKWTKPGDYVDSTMQTIAFLKKGSVVTPGTPTLAVNHYTASADFNSITSSLYQNDSLAKCVFSGDTNALDLTNLLPGTTYYLLVYVVKNTDSLYSTSATAAGTTQANKPSSLTGVAFSGTSFNTTNLNWTKPTGYVDSNMTTLIFLKQSTSVVPTGTVNANPNVYVANANFSGNGTPFINDTAAKCIFNGDGATVAISGLASGIIYYAYSYVVRSTDSIYYSTGVSTGMITTTQPGAVTALNVNATGQSTLTVNWTRPTGYTNTSMTTLVFLKKGSAVNTVTHPNTNPTSFVANTDFSQTGTSYPLDTLAKCVMNSDSNYVNISGLTLNTLYYAMVYVVRTTDSVYSDVASADGKTQGSVAPPSKLASLTLTAKATTAIASWTKDSTYNDTAYTTLVFIKKGSTVQQGAPDLNPTKYIADSNASGTGSLYQNDSNAKCIYKGSLSTVSISGLTGAATYYLAAYVVRKSDSSYSVAATASATTPSGPVSLITFTGQSASTTKISWTKPTGYVNANYTTLVFLKADNAVNSGTATRPLTSYTASTVFGSGTKFQNDSLAYCVFKLDTNYVTVSNLIQNKTYYALIYVVHDADSVYSPEASGNGSPLGPPAVFPINQINSINSTTGNPDSLNKRASVRGIVYGFNEATTGLKFLLRDATGGITILNSTKTFGYTVKEGDSIEAQGNVGTTRGLLTLTIDTLLFRDSSHHTLKTPSPTTHLNETTENDLVKVNSMHFLTTQTGNWFATTYTVVLDASGDTAAIRIYSTSALAGKPVPTSASFSIVGMGSQTSTSTVAPFLFNGYQIIPRTVSDIKENIVDTLSAFHLLFPVDSTTISMQGVPTTNLTFGWSASHSSVNPTVSYSLLMDTVGGDFSSPKMTITTTDTLHPVEYSYVSNSLGLSNGQVYHAIWKVVASDSVVSKTSSQTFAITFNRGLFDGLNNLSKDEFIMYPNPASDKISIRHRSPILSVTLMDQLGRNVQTNYPSSSQVEITTSHLLRGLYFVTVQTEQGLTTQKILLH